MIEATSLRLWLFFSFSRSSSCVATSGFMSSIRGNGFAVSIIFPRSPPTRAPCNAGNPRSLFRAAIQSMTRDDCTAPSCTVAPVDLMNLKTVIGTRVARTWQTVASLETCLCQFSNFQPCYFEEREDWHRQKCLCHPALCARTKNVDMRPKHRGKNYPESKK